MLDTRRQFCFPMSKAFVFYFKGNLVTIEDEETHNFIISEIDLAITSSSFVWIGGYRVSGVWTWRDGTTFKFTNWKSGQPDDYGGKEDCILYSWNPPQWNDLECEESHPYICQYQAAIP